MGDGSHAGHQVRGRYRSAQQIEHEVGRLHRDDFFVLECGTVDDCYAQVGLTLQGVYDIEYRDGSPERHYRTRTHWPCRDAWRQPLMDHSRGMVDELPGREFGDIAIAPFAVADDAGRRWGLFDRTVEYGFPHAELLPNRLGFDPPWSGDYDT